jgi:hypothetical protein
MVSAHRQERYSMIGEDYRVVLFHAVYHSPSLYLSWYRKWHAIQGNLAALFLVEMIGDALDEISKASAFNYDQVIRELEEEDDANYKQAQNSILPQGLSKETMEEPGDINLEDVFKTPNFCHTARVPAESRHKGILLEGPPGDLFNYQQGVSEAEALSPNDSELFRLVRDDGSRQKCEVQLNIDAKDFFYVNDQDGWKKLVLPNDAELKEYSRGQKLRGLIAVCFAVCPWGKCPKGNLDASTINETTAAIQVNGEPVVGFTKIKNCEFLRSSQGHYFTPNSDSRFEIRARTIQSNTFLRIGAFIVW